MNFKVMSAYSFSITKGYYDSSQKIKDAIWAMRKNERERVENMTATMLSAAEDRRTEQ